MSVRVIQPADGSLAEVVRVASDAADNPHAIAEIEEWASREGYMRSNEYWLQVVTIDGKSLFVGTCYRALTFDQVATEQRISRRSELRTRTNP